MSPSARPVPPPAHVILGDVARALAEDIGHGDPSAALLPDAPPGHARVTCKERAVIAGRPWFEACLHALDPAARIDWHVADGDAVAPGTVLCDIHADRRAIVTAERSALNFLQLLSATATTTADHVAALAGTGARLLDTRKTLPGLRLAQKYAVRCGGGHNHRIGLYDTVMLKENHITAAGGIAAAVAASRSRFPGLPVVVEVETMDELAEAVAAQPDRILLDDFDLDGLRAAVAWTAGRVPLEASGGMDLERLRAVAGTGVDCISVGALTKHVRAIDLSLRLL